MHLSPPGLPSPALFQTPSYSVQEYDRDNVTIRVLWQSPHDDGGAPVVNYTITVSPGLVPLTTTATNAMVTLPYNVMHTVSIVVTNCNGSSSVVMETIPAIGMARYPSLTMNHCICLWGMYARVWSVEGCFFSLVQELQLPSKMQFPVSLFNVVVVSMHSMVTVAYNVMHMQF